MRSSTRSTRSQRPGGKTITQVALNWLLTRPSVANVVVGARDETQLLQNLGMVGWTLSADDVAKLDAASYEVPVYPYWHQKDSIDGIRSRRPGSSAARAPIDHQSTTNQPSIP